jgi:hypothetical protein
MDAESDESIEGVRLDRTQFSVAHLTTRMMRSNIGCRVLSSSVFRRGNACVGSLMAMPSLLRDFKEF